MSDISEKFAKLAAQAPILANRPAAARIARMQQLWAAVWAAKDDIYAAAQSELGCSPHDVNGQLLIVKADIDFISRHLAQWVKPELVPNSIMTLGKKSWIHYQAKGVVLNLSTWNAPIAIGLVPAIAAIAAGNAVMLKPSELAPRSAAILNRLISDVFPADEFAVVEGGPEIAQTVLQLPFAHIYYTGGQNVGRLVMHAAAEHFAGVTLEMGGKNPVLIDKSANLTDAARKILWGRLANAGQVCVAPDYALVDRHVHDAFVQELRAQLPAMYDADQRGYRQSPDYARIVNQAHATRLANLLDDAKARGARLESGGEVDIAARFIAPTILSGVTDQMAVMQQEIFGPILPVQPFDSLTDALAAIAARPKPLALYAYARDRAFIDQVLAGTQSGSIVINHNMVQSGTNPFLPFGGINHSGIGRVGGKRGFVEFSNPRSVMEETPLSDGLTPLPPVSDKDRQMMAKLLAGSTQVPALVIKAIETALRLRALFRRSAV